MYLAMYMYNIVLYIYYIEHTQSILKEQFPGIEIKIMFVCKPNMVPKLSPQALKSLNFSVISVCRTPESDTLRNFLGAKWNSVINIVDDTAILGKLVYIYKYIY